MNKFKQFWKNLWNSIKNMFFSFKVMTKEQYNDLVKMLILKKDEMFSKFDANGDGTLQMSELLNGIKSIMKKEKKVEETKAEEPSKVAAEDVKHEEVIEK